MNYQIVRELSSMVIEKGVLRIPQSRAKNNNKALFET